MPAAKPCMFCFVHRAGNIKRSSEHFLSRPVAKAFGIDRDQGEVYRFNADASNPSVVRLNGLKRRCVCRDCNSGWMNQLEHKMTEVAEWFRDGDRELGDDLDLALRKWVLTRHLLLTEIDGNAAEFGDTDNLTEDYVVPVSSLGRAIYEADVDEIRAQPIAMCRSSAGYQFAWAFGFPSVQPRERPQLGRFASTSMLILQELQLWVCTPVIFDHEVFVPGALVACAPHLRARDLRSRPGLPQSTDVTVRFHNVEATAAQIDRLSQLSEDEIRELAYGEEES